MGTSTAYPTPRSRGSGGPLSAQWSDATRKALAGPGDVPVPVGIDTYTWDELQTAYPHNGAALLALDADTFVFVEDRQALYVRGPTGARWERVGAGYAPKQVSSTSALGAISTATPAYYRSTHGDVARPNNGNFICMVGYSNGKRLAVDSSGNVHTSTETGDGWTQVAAGTFAAMIASVSEFFVDSRGYVFFGSATTGQASLYRSTDDGLNWTVSKAFPLTTDSAAPMAEDELGNLYLGTYGSLGAGSNSCKLYKSTDGGANWTDISANMPSVPARHIHGCWWDHYRSLLFVTHGDNGATSRIFVSGDRGATFSTWTNSAQATAMAFSPSHVFYSADQSTDRGVYRTAAPAGITAAGMAATTPTRVFDWRADGGQSSSGGGSGVGNGFAWWGGYENGVVFFPFGSEGVRTSLLASSDNGESWTELETTAAGSMLQEHAYTSQYNVGRDGWLYGRQSTTGALLQVGLWAPGTVCKIQYGATSRGAGVVTPRGRPIGDGLRTPGLVQMLVADYPAPILLGKYGLLIANGYRCGAVGSPAAAFHNADEVTAPTLPTGLTLNTSGVGSAVVSSTTQKLSGANSLKSSTTGGGAGVSQFRLTTSPYVVADGNEAWVSFAAFYTGTIDNQVTDIFQFNSIRISLQTRDGIKTIRVRNSSLALQISNVLPTEWIPIPDGSTGWFRVKMGLLFSLDAAGARRGWVRVWVDTGAGWRQVCDCPAIPTHGGSWDGNAWLGLNVPAGAAAAANLYFDDIRWGTSDPDRAPAVTLTQSPSSVPDLGMSY